jgi:non-heme chloroperoxidase
MTNFATAPDGVRLAYETVGSGRPILLVHGFASDRMQNWKNVGWYETLTGAGFQVTAMDCRGHGESDRPHDDESYGDKMVADIVTVMDAAGLERPDLMGYSMGGLLSIGVLMRHALRVNHAICAGVGETYFESKMHRHVIAAALRAKDPSSVTDPQALAFRTFASQAGKDILALAACMNAPRTMYTADQLGSVSNPVLVIDGDKDTQSGRPEPLADAFANGRAAIIPNRDHMTAVGDKIYKQSVLEFLRAEP